MLAELLIAAALATAECPPTADGSVLPSSDPDWLIKPSADDIAWAYPRQAWIEDLPGKAVITCEVNTEGVAENCKVQSEEPAGYGFGEGAISLATRMRFKLMIRCGKAQRGEVRIPIVFAMQPDRPVAKALDPDDPKVASARRLAEALRIHVSFDQGLEQDAVNALYHGGEMSADERKAWHQAFSETRHGLREKLLDSAVQTIAMMLSPAELDQAIAFYESPTGAKLAWGGEVGLQVVEDISALKRSPYEATHRRFCELSPKSCLEP